MAESLHNLDLSALHFVRREDGTLVAPSGSIVTFTRAISDHSGSEPESESVAGLSSRRPALCSLRVRRRKNMASILINGRPNSIVRTAAPTSVLAVCGLCAGKSLISPNCVRVCRFSGVSP
jgi:hypothetical protein